MKWFSIVQKSCKYFISYQVTEIKIKLKINFNKQNYDKILSKFT